MRRRQVGVLWDGRLLYQGATQALVDTYLRPRWHLRIAGDAGPVAVALRRQEWATAVSATPDGVLVDAA